MNRINRAAINSIVFLFCFNRMLITQFSHLQQFFRTTKTTANEKPLDFAVTIEAICLEKNNKKPDTLGWISILSRHLYLKLL